LGSRYEIVIWFLTFIIVTGGIWGLNNSEIKEIDKTSFNHKEDPYTFLNELLVYPKSKKSMVISILKKELSKAKLPLLKQIEIKDNEVYAILYNDILCRLGNFDNLEKKLDLVLEVINTAKRQGISIKEIDVRSLKFPTIVEGEVKDNE